MATAKQSAVRVVDIDPQKIAAGFKNVQLKEVDIPPIADGAALVKIHLRPVNPFDLVMAAGHVPGIEAAVPFTVGSEAIGTVVKSASGKFREGQRVVAAGWPAGTWTNFTAISEASLVAVPEGMSDEAAAQFAVNSITAVGLVDNAAVPQGKYLLQAGAGSVVGRQVAQYAKHIGIKTINIVRRDTPELAAIGAGEVIVSTREDVFERVKEITGGAGAWAGLDPVAGTFTSTMLNSVRDGGTVYVYSTLTGEPVTAQAMDMMPGHKGVRGFVLARWLKQDGPEQEQERLQKTLQLIADGTIAPTALNTFKLEDYSAAIKAHLSPSRGGGKIFLSSD